MRRLAEVMLQRLLEEEVSAHLNARPNERTDGRRGYRNGHYKRSLTTRVGKVELLVPRDREGRFSTELFERYQRSEKAFVLSLMEMYVKGVSTRKVKKITQKLCGVDVSKSQVSELAKNLDEQVEAWRSRPIEKCYPYLIVDALFEKVRLDLEFSEDEVQIKRRKALEGRFVVATTVDGERLSPGEVIDSYKSLQKVERSFRHIKSFLKIRPIYHRLWTRIRAHVLICFLAYYLTWHIGRDLRAEDITTEVERVLEYWDQLLLSRTTVQTSKGSVSQWNWTLGEKGQKIKSEIKEAGLWRSTDAYKRSATKSLAPKG